MTRPRGLARCSLHLRALHGVQALCVSLLGVPALATAQESLSPLAPSGSTVTPAFEGWFRNADGSFSLSFGYLNRNAAETVDVPVGDNNFISPGAQNQGQPTHFETRRHWGVFAVRVPADFGTKQVTWILVFRGQRYAIPGSLRADWEIDAVQGEASADNTPPGVQFDGDSAEARGPRGVTAGPLTVTVGTPLVLRALVKDDAKSEPVAKSASPVSVAWFRHQGPGDVTFTPATSKLAPVGGAVTTSVMFSQPGEYLLRLRANDSALASAGHAQCCWTNAFVRVLVTR